MYKDLERMSEDDKVKQVKDLEQERNNLLELKEQMQFDDCQITQEFNDI